MNFNPSTPGYEDRPPLVDAAEGGHLDIVAYLIEELQCDPSYASGEEKVTPLHAAAASGHLDVIRYLDYTDKKMQSSSQILPRQHSTTSSCTQ